MGHSVPVCLTRKGHSVPVHLTHTGYSVPVCLTRMGHSVPERLARMGHSVSIRLTRMGLFVPVRLTLLDLSDDDMSIELKRSEFLSLSLIHPVLFADVRLIVHSSSSSFALSFVLTFLFLYKPNAITATSRVSICHTQHP